jgi:alpha-amylase
MKRKERKSNKLLQVFACILIVNFVFTIMLPTGSSFNRNTSLLQVKAATTESTAPTKNSDTFSWDNASVYFLLTDRFHNGNTSNDHSYNRGLDRNGNIIDYSDTSATFHGGDFAGITQKIEEGYFNALGVNALWISAPYEQIHGYVVGSDSSNSFAHYAYHGYYPFDYTQTDESFGTADEFKELVDTAHEHGIRIILDIVMNHAGYNTLYDMANYNFGTLSAGWEDTYYKSTGINNSSYHSLIDYTSSPSDWANWWGADWVRSGIAGYDAGGSTNLTMSLAGLPDFKTESVKAVGIPKILQTKWKREGRYDAETAKLSSYLSQRNMAMTPTNILTYWLQSWVREYGIDGFRCDTAKHVDLSSWATLKNACVEALRDWKTRNPEKALDDLDFWMTGEVWDHGVYKDEYYTKGGFDSLINFSTQGGGILAKNTVASTYQSFADKINRDPEFNVLSYISSHDSILARGNSIYTGSAFLLLPGGIQIFYGDETDREVDSSASTNGDHEVRGDMNWGNMNKDTLAHWQKVGTFRRNHIAVGAGDNVLLSSTEGVAFARIYNNTAADIYDKIAGCIGSTSNKDVTIDVSSLWADGQVLTNAYDFTSAVVTNGKVTFNSGANGTILIEEPDGKPLVSITGNAKFHNTDEVTLHLTDADYAKVSIDGAKKFIAFHGDTFTIGETAYEGDTVSVTVEATNVKGTRTATYTFYKAYADEDISEETPQDYPAILYVKSHDGAAPYVYAWKDANTELMGKWPGTRMTVQNEEGYYVMDLGTTDKYNVVLNNGNQIQTKDISSLEGGVWIELTSSNYTYNIVKREVTEKTTPITFYVKSYTGAAPYLYIWDTDGNTYNGSFPGKALNETTAESLYTLTIDSYSPSVNCIVSYGGNTNQSDNITGITKEVLITITSPDCSTYEIEKAASHSYYDVLKKELRITKNLTEANYTTETYSALYSYVEPADALIALGRDKAEEEALQEMIQAIQAAYANLILAKPTVSGIETASTRIFGTAPYESTVTVTAGGISYTTKADDITGEFSVTTAALKPADTVSLSCTLGRHTSNTHHYPVNGEEIEVTDITLNYSDVTIDIGKTIPLEATLSPANATNRSITWSSGNRQVASVSDEGVVTGISEGTAIVTAAASNGLTAAVTIKVTAQTAAYLYFEKPSSWSDTIYAYIWNDAITYKNAPWPGVVTQVNADGLSVIEWPKEYSGTDLNIIFTDSRNQTADMKAIKNGYYTGNGYSHTMTTD